MTASALVTGAASGIGRATALAAHERARTQGRNLTGRSGRPEEIAATIAFLLSNDVGFMSGSLVAVDGAWTAG